jgi:hypothetical protein
MKTFSLHWGSGIVEDASKLRKLLTQLLGER